MVSAELGPNRKLPPSHLFAWGGTRPHGGSTPCAWAAAGTRTDGCTCSCSCRWWWCSAASPPGKRGGKVQKRCVWKEALTCEAELKGEKKQVWERKERGASAEMLIKEVTGLGWEDKWGEIKKRKESRIWRGKVIRGLARWTKKTALFAVNVIQTDPTFNQCVSFNHTQVCWFSTCCCV